MARFTFWLVMVFLLFMGINTAYLRHELTAPGLSTLAYSSRPLLTDATRNAGFFNAMIHAHGLLGVTLMYLIASFSGFVASDLGVRMGRIPAWLSFIGAIVGLTLLLLLVSLEFDSAAASGWMIYIEHASALGSTFLEQSHDKTSNQFLSFYQFFTFGLPMGMALLSATALIGTRAGYFWGSLIAACIVVLTISALVTIPNEAEFTLFTISAIAMLCVLFLQLADADTPSAPFLTTGLLFFILASSGILIGSQLLASLAPDAFGAKPSIRTAEQHAGPGSFVVFLMFGALSNWVAPRISYTALWLFSGGLAVVLALIILSMFGLGIAGYSSIHIDYYEEYAPDNQAQNIASVIFGILISVGFFAIWRRRKLAD